MVSYIALILTTTTPAIGLPVDLSLAQWVAKASPPPLLLSTPTMIVRSASVPSVSYLESIFASGILQVSEKYLVYFSSLIVIRESI